MSITTVPGYLQFLGDAVHSAILDAVKPGFGGIESFALDDLRPIFIDTDAVHFRVSLNGLDFAVSIALAPAQDLASIVAEREEADKNPLVIAFNIDHRIANPGLHALHRAWAIETLVETNEFIESMSDRSQFQASMILQAIHDQVKQFIFEDAAWFEAAALIQSHVDLSPYTESARKTELDVPG